MFFSLKTLKEFAARKLIERMSVLSSKLSLGKLGLSLVFSWVSKVKCFDMSVFSTASMMNLLV